MAHPHLRSAPSAFSVPSALNPSFPFNFQLSIEDPDLVGTVNFPTQTAFRSPLCALCVLGALCANPSFPFNFQSTIPALLGLLTINLPSLIRWPSNISATSSELYPFVFFALQNLSNKWCQFIKY